MKTKNSDLEYIAFNINSVFSLDTIITTIVRSLKLLCMQYTVEQEIFVSTIFAF